MKNIVINCTGEQKIYHEHFKPFICVSDVELPKMYNAGYNSFRFIGGEPNFTGQNMPQKLKKETENFIYYECQIQVLRKDNSTVSGYYYKSVNKQTKEEREVFSFD